MTLKYIGFYKGRTVEVEAASKLDAQTKAAAHFKAKKRYDVAVVLAEKDGKPVMHNGAELP